MTDQKKGKNTTTMGKLSETEESGTIPKTGISQTDATERMVLRSATVAAETSRREVDTDALRTQIALSRRRLEETERRMETDSPITAEAASPFYVQQNFSKR